MDIAYLSLGAAMGANLRYWLGAWLAERLGSAFPHATLVINLTGSLLLGFIMTLTTQRYLINPRVRMTLTTGFLGAYTTFSTYEYESVTLMMSGHWGSGVLALEESAILGAIAAGAGMMLGRLVGGR
ncbi:MAG: fluoride efflux transporter CrcB [Anaerolineae bacterium]|nr:fluoride efflux transporter CrcB [Anaerolineae bacterium]